MEEKQTNKHTERNRYLLLVTYYPKSLGPKTTNMYYFTFSVGQESGSNLAEQFCLSVSHKAEIKASARGTVT